MSEKPNRRKLAHLGLLVLVGAAPWLVSAHRENPRLTLSVSIPELQTTSKEKVVGFDFHIESGRISAVPDIPIGWDVAVDNNPSWNTEIKGSSRIGAAALSTEFFEEFVAVEKDTSLGTPFRMQGEIVVTEDFATERHISVAMKDFRFKRLASRNSGK